MLLIRKLRTLYRCSPLLIEAFVLLGIARLIILILPFRWLEPYLGKRMVESTLDELSKDPQQIRQIAWAVNKISNFTPWQSKCLVQAIAAKRMLQSRQIVSTLYLGVTKNNSQQLEAHAWLRSGSIYLTGGQGHKHFTVVAMFAEGG